MMKADARVDLYVVLFLPTVAVPTNQATPHPLPPWDSHCLGVERSGAPSGFPRAPPSG